MSRRHLLMLLTLAAVWGSSFMFIKISVRDIAPSTALLGRVGIGALVVETRIDSGTAAVLQAGIAQRGDTVPGWKSITSVVVLGVVGTAFAYLLYYGLVAGAGASRAILITYLVPAMALFYGSVLLGESITASALGGLALILVGAALGSGTILWRRPASSLAE